jgi:N-carbamoyl-L-amino-acid hydrolase
LNATLAQLNAAAADDAVALLDGIYEHSPWIAAAAMVERPFGDLAHLERALVDATRAGGRDAQLALLRAHPKLAGKAMVAGALTAESTDEQARSGLTQCSPEEFARLHALNDAYDARFGWPFILAVRGPTGRGLTRAEIIETFERRLASEADIEFEECLRNVHRIAELRLADRF